MALKTEKTTDHRLFERFSARFPAKLKESRETYGSQMYLRDASAYGARIQSKDRFFLNDSISLDVELPSQTHVSLNGKVIWAHKNELNQWELGLQFHKLSFMHISHLFETATGQTIPNHLAFD